MKASILEANFNQLSKALKSKRIFLRAFLVVEITP